MTDEKKTSGPADESSSGSKPKSKPKAKKPVKKEDAKDKPMVENTSPSKDTSSAEKKERQELTNPLLTILGVVALVVGLVFVYPYLATMFGKQRQVFSSVDQLDERHVQLEKKVSELETLLDQATKAAAPKDTVSETNGGTEPTQASRSSFAKEFVELKQRVAYLERQIQQSQTKMSEVPAVMRKMSFFKKAMLSGASFQNEFNQMTNKVELGDAEVASIIKRMQGLSLSGVPQLEELKRDFVGAAREVRRLSISNDLPWYKKFAERMRSLIVVRKDGKVVGEAAEVDQVLSEIALALQNENLSRVADLSEEFDDLDAPEYQAWLGRTKDRLFVLLSYPVLEASALRKLWKKEAKNRNDEQEGTN